MLSITFKNKSTITVQDNNNEWNYQMIEVSILCSILDNFMNQLLHTMKSELWLLIFDYTKLLTFRLINKQTNELIQIDNANHDSESELMVLDHVYLPFHKSNFQVCGSSMMISPFDKTVVDLKVGVYLFNEHNAYFRSCLFESFNIVYSVDEWKSFKEIQVEWKKHHKEDMFVCCWLKNIKLKPESWRILYMVKAAYTYGHYNKTTYDNNNKWNYQMVIDWAKNCPYCEKNTNSWFKYDDICFDCHVSNQYCNGSFRYRKNVLFASKKFTINQ